MGGYRYREKCLVLVLKYFSYMKFLFCTGRKKFSIERNIFVLGEMTISSINQSLFHEILSDECVSTKLGVTANLASSL